MRRGHDQDTAQSTPYKPVSNSTSGVPFRDAAPGTDEIPLDELDCFIIPAQDQNHVSEPVSFRIPPYLKRYCKIIIQSGRFPYLDLEDLFRHAVTRQIDWLCSIRETLPTHIRPSLHQQAEVCMDDEMRMQVEDVFSHAEERVKHHMARGDTAEVIRLLNLMRQRMAGVYQSARMREYQERFDKTYGSYLRGNPAGIVALAGAVTNAIGTTDVDMDEYEIETEDIQ